jgi:hypothetical protein
MMPNMVSGALLKDGTNKSESLAYIRIEAVLAEQRLLMVFETLGLYCELLVARLGLLEAATACPLDMAESVATLIYCAQRVDIEEFTEIANLFAMKFGSLCRDICMQRCCLIRLLYSDMIRSYLLDSRRQRVGPRASRQYVWCSQCRGDCVSEVGHTLRR